MFGTNDTHEWYDGCCRDRFAADYMALIDTVHATSPGCAVLVCRPVPMYDNEYGLQPALLTSFVLPALDSLAAAGQCPVVDCYSALLPYPQYQPDGVHPDTAGARVIAEEVYKVIMFDPTRVGDRGVGGAVTPNRSRPTGLFVPHGASTPLTHRLSGSARVVDLLGREVSGGRARGYGRHGQVPALRVVCSDGGRE
jgi:hypothetical protein